MSELRFTLETVTPLFLSGADPRGKPELRASSVRGTLRFWLRALLGSIIGDTPDKLNDLRRAEAAVFGSTQLGASPVIVKLTGNPQTKNYRPLPHNPNKTFTFQGISPNQSLTLTVTTRQPYQPIPEIIGGVLLLWVLCGGLGKRSRRGFGSFIIRSASDGFPIELPNYSNAQRFCEQLPSLLEETTCLTKSYLQKLELSPGTLSNPPRFSVMHKHYTKILFCKNSFNSWEEAMKSFWNVLRSKQYHNARIFGFTENTSRQASPLHLRIVKLGKAYHLLITVFRVQFSEQQPSWKLMEEFLKENKQRWNGEFVFGGDATWE
jgi:CRISPR-associated protein Cmr1